MLIQTVLLLWWKDSRRAVVFVLSYFYGFVLFDLIPFSFGNHLIDDLCACVLVDIVINGFLFFHLFAFFFFFFVGFVSQPNTQRTQELGDWKPIHGDWIHGKLLHATMVVLEDPVFIFLSICWGCVLIVQLKKR